jgi:hypothetical protein
MGKPLNKSTEIFQRLWVRAYQEGEVTLKCKTKQEANRVRFSLYAAVKHVKLSQQESILKEAVENCSISYVDESTLLIRSVLNDPTLQYLAQIVGEDLGNMAPHALGDLTPNQQLEADAQASLERTMRRLAGEDLPLTVNGVDPADIPFNPRNQKPRLKKKWELDDPEATGLPEAEYHIAMAKWLKGEPWE